jgi:hypothetical protein
MRGRTVLVPKVAVGEAAAYGIFISKTKSSSYTGMDRPDEAGDSRPNGAAVEPLEFQRLRRAKTGSTSATLEDAEDSLVGR